MSISLAASLIEGTTNIQSTKATVGAVFILSILVEGVVVTNALVLEVLEQTREIGKLRAVGWRQLWVLWVILNESVS